MPDCKFCEFPDHDPDIYDAPEEIKGHLTHLVERIPEEYGDEVKAVAVWFAMMESRGLLK